MHLSPAERKKFDSCISPVPFSGCWLWDGASAGGGYGSFCLHGKPLAAHRVSYELHCAPIPKGKVIDHLCRVRACVNPAHLEAVTQRENVRRGIVGEVHRARYALITHCPHGHEYSASNTYFNPGKNCRMCRACGRIRARRRRNANRIR